MSVLPVETARCADCYEVMFKDEMNRCADGHWTCPGCACSCSTAAALRGAAAYWQGQPTDGGLPMPGSSA